MQTSDNAKEFFKLTKAPCRVCLCLHYLLLRRDHMLQWIGGDLDCCSRLSLSLMNGSMVEFNLLLVRWWAYYGVSIPCPGANQCYNMSFLCLYFNDRWSRMDHQGGLLNGCGQALISCVAQLMLMPTFLWLVSKLGTWIASLCSWFVVDFDFWQRIHGHPRQ